MATRRVIGLAAGPSLVGVDAVVLEAQGPGLDVRPHLLHWLAEPFSREFREALVHIGSADHTDTRLVAMAHRGLGDAFALAAQHLADGASLSWQNVLCVGCSGLTAWHEGEGRSTTTLCLGAPAVVAERTGLTTISDFRWRDLAAGGQGTPLGALCDHALFNDPGKNRLVVHLGGLVQVTYLPEGAAAGAVRGWEAGPGNVLLDALIQHLTGGKELFDAGGKTAVQGRLIPELLERWSKHPFLLRKPPRSLHRNTFDEAFARQTIVQGQQMGWAMHDLLCTAHHFVVHALIDGLRRFLPQPLKVDQVILTGGGTRNGLLWKLLESHLEGIPLQKSDELGYPAEARDAIHAALLACCFLDSQPASIPASSGASGSRVLGSVTPGSPFNWARCLSWLVGRPEFFQDDANE